MALVILTVMLKVENVIKRKVKNVFMLSLNHIAIVFSSFASSSDLVRHDRVYKCGVGLHSGCHGYRPGGNVCIHPSSAMCSELA